MFDSVILDRNTSSSWNCISAQNGRQRKLGNLYINQARIMRF